MNITIKLNCAKRTCGYASNQRCTFLDVKDNVYSCKLFKEEFNKTIELKEVEHNSQNLFAYRCKSCLQSDSLRVAMKRLRGGVGDLFG